MLKYKVWFCEGCELELVLNSIIEQGYELFGIYPELCGKGDYNLFRVVGRKEKNSNEE